jgi:hypothetical protein
VGKSRAGEKMLTVEKEVTGIQADHISRKAERFALNTYNLRPLEGETPVTHRLRFVSDVASGIIEMGRELEDRTNPVAIPLNSFQELANRSRKLRNKALVDQAENQATENLLSNFQNLPYLFSLNINFPQKEIPEKIVWQHLLPIWPQVCKHISEIILWVSPPTEERGRKENHEARFCFYFKGLIDGKPWIIILAACGKQDPEECLDIASQLNWNYGYNPADIPENEQELRENPFLLFLPKKKAWETLGQKFGNEEVFAAIARGSCFEKKIKALETADEVYQKTQKDLFRARTSDDYFWVGVDIEKAIFYSGSRLLSLSSCGDSYLDVLYSNPLYTNPFGNQIWGPNALMISQNFSSSLGGESKKYVHNCGNCGVVINDHLSKGYKCKNCGGIYEGC